MGSVCEMAQAMSEEVEDKNMSEMCAQPYHCCRCRRTDAKHIEKVEVQAALKVLGIDVPGYEVSITSFSHDAALVLFLLLN